MSNLKSIEMQVALPRTHDVGKLQNSMQQRGTHVAEHMHSAVEKETQKLRTQVGELNQKQKNKINKDGNTGHNNSQGHHQDKGNDGGSEHKDEQHPYKGNFIDFSG